MATVTQMKAFDAIRLKVHDDGDVELTKVPTIDMDGINHGYSYYPVAEIAKGSLDSELVSYGCDADRVKEAIDEVVTSEYHTEVIV